MKPDAFDHLCEDFYDLTREQREGLLDLLQSRIWLYDSDDSEFERIYEFDDGSIKIILREIQIESLAYALKGTTDDLRKKFFKNMPKAGVTQLARKMKALGPVRSSQCDLAQATILETINHLAAAGKVELPPSLDRLPPAFEIEAHKIVSDDMEARRLPTKVLLTLADSCLKSLIREVEVELWVDFLWYINDARLARKVLAFSSPQLANTLMHDISIRWQSVNSDTATEMELEKGKRAMEKVLGMFQKLADEGQIWIPNRRQSCQ